MKRVTVHELASEFGTTSEAVLKLLRGRGFFVRSGASRVTETAVEWLRFEFTVDQPSPPPPVGVTGPRAPRSPRRLPDYDWGPIRGWRRPVSLPDALTRRRPAQRSTRSVPVYGTKRPERDGLDLVSVEAGLMGSPYSLPSEQASYLTTSFLPRVAALSIRAQRELQRTTSEHRGQLRRVTRSSEIYESNRIEGLGPDLATTDQILNAHDLHRRVGVSVAQQAIERCLRSEPKVREVIGLGAARVLAELFCAEPERPLTESDIRQLHDMILVGDSRRGRYKGYLNEIEGATHVPTAPSDTPAAMSQLVNWLASTQLSPLWRAAVTHAWLTHIHPFHDGNGRIARLLANLVLIREGLPPLIVRAAGDRGAYLDALAASDVGGDILPLARVFRDVLSRAVQDLSDPQFADQLFQNEVAQRSAPRQVQWNRMLDEFLSELAPQLILHRLNLFYIGEVTDAELARIGVGRPENAWIAKVSTDASARDLLLHVAAPTTLNRSFQPSGLLTPSIFVSVKNGRQLDARQYLPVGQTTFTYEFTPLIESNTFLIRRNRDRSRFPVDEAASRAAEHLARAHRQLIGRPH